MGTLYIVSTPIGNLEDITIRALKTLFSVEIIACEDTRRTGLLLDELKKRYSDLVSCRSREGGNPATINNGSPIRSGMTNTTKLVSCHDHNELQILPQLIEYLKQDKNAALVSDAGTPLISDPGYKLVNAALKHKINVVSIPGASAVLTALTSSGLPTNNFTFLGYFPEKSSHRIKLFENLIHLNRFKLTSTYIFYCAPHKLEQTLTDLQSVFGDIEIVVARELTKIHEEIWSGSISSFPLGNIKGELVLLFRIESK